MAAKKDTKTSKSGKKNTKSKKAGQLGGRWPKKSVGKVELEIPTVLRRKKKERLEDLPLPNERIEYLARTLAKQIDKEIFDQKYAKVADVLALVGAGAFLAASVVAPGLPRAVKLLSSPNRENEAWKRFNIPHLKRTLERLERQKLIETETTKDSQIVKITDAGRRRILKYSLEQLEIKKPKSWDRKWRLVSYDIPSDLRHRRDVLRAYLESWGFYPLQESVYLHAYPCEKEIEFLRAYLRISEFVRILTVTKIENDVLFRDFFDI